MSATCVVEAAAFENVEAQGLVGPPVEALEAVLGIAEEDVLKAIATSWVQSPRSDIERFREGVALVVEVAGLPATCFQKAGTLHPRSNLNVEGVINELCHAVEDAVPLPRSLADMAASQATAVARSLQMFFLFGCSALLLAHKANSDGLVLRSLLDCFSVMAGTSLRCLRHAAISAALGALEALVQGSQRLAMDIDACQKQLGTIDIGNDGSSNTQRRRRLICEIDEQTRLFQSLRSHASMIRDSVLRTHLRDKISGIRLLVISSISFLIRNDPDSYRCPPWPERILRAFCDPNAEVRFCAVQAAADWYSSLESEHESGLKDTLAANDKPIGVSRQLDELVPHAASLLAERARDTNPKVALAAVKALRHPKLAIGLGDKDIDSLVALCFYTSDSLLRREVAFFIDEHLLVDPGVGAATRRTALPIRHRGGEHMQATVLQGSEALRNLYRAEHGLLVLTDFFVHHLKRDSFGRIERIIEALWGSAPCLQRWTTMADLCLLGEGDGPSRSVTALPAMQRLAMLHVIDATLRRASDEYSRGENVEALEEAAKALLPRLSRLLDLFIVDEACMKPLSMSTKLVVEHACRLISVSPPRALLPALQKAISKQFKLQTAEHLVDALVMLARQSSEARTLIFSLVKDLRNKSEVALRTHRDHVNVEELSLCLVTLLAFCKRGVDISSGHYGLLSASLKFLSDPRLGGGRHKDVRAAACLTLQLLNLGMLLIMWRTRAVVSAAAAETPQASRFDLDENGLDADGISLCGPPASPQDREMLPHVALQLFEIAVRLLGSSSEAFDSYACVVRMQAVSTYLTLAQAILGSDGHLGILRGFLREQRSNGIVHIFTPPKEHVVALERGLASLYEIAQANLALTPSRRLRSDQVKEDRQSERVVLQMAAYRKSMEQLMDPLADIKNAGEFPYLAACVASWMVSTCEIEAIYAGAPGRLVLAQAAHHEMFPLISEVAGNFAGSLRTRALSSDLSACQFFSLQFAAVDYTITHESAEAGQRLSEDFVLAARALSPTGSEDARLKNGFFKAMRAFVNSAVAVKQPARLEAVLPWLRGSCCRFLSLADAKALQREFSTKFGAGVIQGAVSRLQVAMRALLLALHPLANAVTDHPQRKLGAFSSRLVREARRRLRLRSKKASAGKSLSTPVAPTGWLEKKRGPPSIPSRRVKFLSNARTDSGNKLRVEANTTVAERRALNADGDRAPVPPKANAKAKRQHDSRGATRESKIAPKARGKRKTTLDASQEQAVSEGVPAQPVAEAASMGVDQINAIVTHSAPAGQTIRRGLKRSIASDDLGSKTFSPGNTTATRLNCETEGLASASLSKRVLSECQQESIGRNSFLPGDVSASRPVLEGAVFSSASEVATTTGGRNWRLRNLSERVSYY